MKDRDIDQIIIDIHRRIPRANLKQSPEAFALNPVLFYEFSQDLHKEADEGYNIAQYNYINDMTLSRQCIKISPHAPTPEAPVPVHRHEFIEMNYVYAGTCINVVNDTDLFMQEGDLLIMDTQTKHFIKEMDSECVVFNIIFIPQYIAKTIEYTFPDHSELSAFFASSIYSLSAQPNYILFHNSQNETCCFILNALIKEYHYTKVSHSDVLLAKYTNILLLLLDRMLIDTPWLTQKAYRPNSKIAEILNYISQNCSHCTLETAQAKFGYSANYIQKLIKKYTGKSFTEIRNSFRLDLVNYRIQTTGDTIRKIAEDCGFQNMTYFYQQYKKQYGRLPREKSN